MTAGYSQKTLVQKLGYKPDESVYCFGLPESIGELFASESVQLQTNLPAVWAHGFFNWQAELEQFLQTTNLDLIEQGFWVSWPKKASRIETDVTEQTLRDLILPLGWVDTKVAAIDDVWSGLKFLRRKA